jgi:DNA-binding CsgD family transcriptional regulator
MLGRDGGSGLLFVGAAGIGKSALLDAAARAASRSGRTVLRATGARSETRLPFAGLHQLLYPLTSNFSSLASPQHAALLAAFGRLGGPALDVFLIALATLELCTRAARGAGLLVVVDDLHWLDDASAQVLGFVARRVASEPVVLLAATRPGYDDPLSGAGVPARMLRPLSAAEAARLVRLRHPDLDERRRGEVLGQAQGNPLALEELPLSGAEPAAGAALPLTARLERSLAPCLSGLSATARSALVVAAASDAGDLAEIGAAVELAVPGADAAALCPAVDAGILVVANAAVRFDHPLLRQAAYQSADADSRHRAHAALAEVLAGQPGRRAWHLAAAALVPDETIAAELEHAAESAARRGAGLASAAAWERSASLTPRADRRAQRLLCAAGLSLELGRLEHAASLAAAAEALPLTLAGKASLALVKDALHPGPAGDPLPVRTLIDLAAELTGAGQPDLAFRLLLAAAARTWASDPGPAARTGLTAAVSRLPFPADDPRRLAIGGYLEPARCGDLIARHVAELSTARLDPLPAELAMSVHLVGAGEAVTAVQRAITDRARQDGKRAALPRLLTRQAWNAIAAADWAEAWSAAQEAVDLAEETRQPLWQAAALSGQAMIAGSRGDEQAAGQLAQRAEAIALPARTAPVLCSIQHARGVTAIAAGRYDEAFDHLARVFDRADPSFQESQSGWALGDFAEAAVRTARADDARKILDSIRPAELDSVAPWTGVALSYAEALLAGDDVAEAEFGRAAETGLARWPAYRARLLLEYGRWLRRQRRNAEARPPLRTAREICEAHGLRPWAALARSELRASGEPTEAPGAEPAVPLSPQELRIARLAAEGLSNREIGQRLCLSHRTVGSHLYRMFPKLGITARAQLRPLLGAGDGRLPLPAVRPGRAGPCPRLRQPRRPPGSGRGRAASGRSPRRQPRLAAVPAA